MPFDPQPVLRGRGLSVRPLQGDDFDALYEVARDPLVWAQHPERDRHDGEVFKRFFAEALESGGALAVIADDAGVIGSSRFDGYDEQRSEVEIGWTFLSRSHWGGVTNRELKRLMLDHAFQFVERVVFLVGPKNHRSQRALEKIGARRAGTRSDGSGQENVLFELRRHDFYTYAG
jgi:N-acetyltransferase